jgi:hypothetical protein
VFLDQKWVKKAKNCPKWAKNGQNYAILFNFWKINSAALWHTVHGENGVKISKKIRFFGKTTIERCMKRAFWGKFLR